MYLSIHPPSPSFPIPGHLPPSSPSHQHTCRAMGCRCITNVCTALGCHATTKPIDVGGHNMRKIFLNIQGIKTFARCCMSCSKANSLLQPSFTVADMYIYQTLNFRFTVTSLPLNLTPCNPSHSRPLTLLPCLLSLSLTGLL